MSELDAADPLTDYADWLEKNARTGRNARLFYYRGWYMDRFPWVPGSRILDAGAWVGASAIEWAGRGHDVTAIEASPTYCRWFRRNLQARPVEVQQRVRLVEGLIENFDEPAAYDAAVCTEIWGHFLQPAVVMGSLARALRPGGQLFAAQLQQQTSQDRRHVTGEELLRLMQHEGLTGHLEAVEADGHHPMVLAVGVKS